MESGTKKCTKCGEVKPLEEFNQQTAGALGRNSRCKLCSAAANAAYRKANPEKVRAGAAAYRKANPEKARAGVIAWQKANPEKAQASDASWRKANPEKVRARLVAYQKAHPDESRKRSAARRARKLKACPVWADNAAITEFYARAQAQTTLTGVEHQVDHQVPLKSKLVSGLHVEFNLRVITKAENLSKGNRSWPDMP